MVGWLGGIKILVGKVKFKKKMFSISANIDLLLILKLGRKVANLGRKNNYPLLRTEFNEIMV